MHLDWRPIDTAPKDGTEILVAHNGAVSAAFWVDTTTYTDEEVLVNGYWSVHVTTHCDETRLTHWMPLPEPPAGD